MLNVLYVHNKGNTYKYFFIKYTLYFKYAFSHLLKYINQQELFNRFIHELH